MIFVSERFDASPDNANWFSCGDAGFSGCSGPAAMQAEATFQDWSNEGSLDRKAGQEPALALEVRMARPSKTAIASVGTSATDCRATRPRA